MPVNYCDYFQSRQSHPLSNKEKKFCRWIDHVEKTVIQQTGLHLLDLQDEMYMVHFEEGLTPSQMAQIVIDSFVSW